MFPLNWRHLDCFLFGLLSLFAIWLLSHYLLWLFNSLTLWFWCLGNHGAFLGILSSTTSNFLFALAFLVTFSKGRFEEKSSSVTFFLARVAPLPFGAWGFVLNRQALRCATTYPFSKFYTLQLQQFSYKEIEPYNIYQHLGLLVHGFLSEQPQGIVNDHWPINIIVSQDCTQHWELLDDYIIRNSYSVLHYSA